MPHFIQGNNSTHWYIIKQNLKISLEKKFHQKTTLRNLENVTVLS